MPLVLYLHHQSNQTRLKISKYCEVMKPADIPSCLEGGEQQDKHSIGSFFGQG